MKKIEFTADELNMIQTLRRKKAQQGAEDTHSNEGGNIQTVEVKKAKRIYKPQPLYQVVKKAKALFMRQLVQNGETKAECLKIALQRSNDLYQDQLRFWQDFRAERERLTDSNRFCKACEAMGLKPTYVADNTVFEGKGTLEKVLKEGLQVLGEKVHMFNCPLWKDTEELYKAKAQEGEAKVEAEKKEANE